MGEQLTAIAEAVRAAHGWTLLQDLTETTTGLATPVQQVATEHGPAVLRIGMTERQHHGYLALSGSGVTPRVLEHGTAPVQWLLAEWVDGIPLLPPEAPVTFEQLVAVTEPVLSTARTLYTVPAPDQAHELVVASARKRELDVAAQMALTRSTPALGLLAQHHWRPAFVLHGDLVPSNVLRQADGCLRLIDPEGGLGPAEEDAGWWCAGLLSMAAYTAGTLSALVSLAGDLLAQVAAVAPHLDPLRLRGWTADALVHLALTARGQGADAGHYRALVALGGSLFPVPGMTPAGGTLPAVTGGAAPGALTGAGAARNAPCPCGSGRKFKRCCGRPASAAG